MPAPEPLPGPETAPNGVLPVRRTRLGPPPPAPGTADAAPGIGPAGGRRTTLRWRLTIVYAAVAVAVGLLLLALSIVLVDRAARAGVPTFSPPLGETTDGRVVDLNEFSRALRQQAVHRLYQQGLLALLVLSALGLVVSYFVAGRLLRPLQQITTTAQRLSAERLDARIDLPGPADELKELADTFDAMLGRLEASFEAQRRFVADASHELRTPLAVMRTEVDVALADPDATAADLRAAATVVRTATERADRLVDSLLLLARNDRLSVDRLPLTELVELSAVATAALRAVQSEVVEQGLTVDVEWLPAVVSGDPVLLERLAGNLVENAVRHNVRGGRVHASTGTTPEGRAWLLVANTGADVAPGEVERLFEPFRRGGVARTARRGAGLGLSIARAVARVHGGELYAVPRTAGGGLLMTVDLPAAPSS